MLLLLLLLLLAQPLQAAASPAEPDAPNLMFWDYGTLLANRRLIQDSTAGLRSFRGALYSLKSTCDGILSSANSTLYSVMAKNVTAASGDRHDYMSLARYYWPDPNMPGGLPYIRKDGEPNPEVDGVSDQALWRKTVTSVQALALGHFFFSDTRYAIEACRIIRQWFLDPATSMNPNLNYGSIIRGRRGDAGRPQGILDFRDVYIVFDALEIVKGPGGFSEADLGALKRWFGTYLEWLWGGDLGGLAREMVNNHGTWYRAQVTAVSIFVNRTEVGVWATRNLTWHIDNAIDMTRGGVMKFEVDRVASFAYSAFDLRALLIASRLASTYNFNLLRYRGPSLESIKSGLDYLLPHFLTNGTNWPFSRRGFDNRALLPVLKLAISLRLEHVGVRAVNGMRYLDAVKIVQPRPATHNLARLWNPAGAFDAPELNVSGGRRGRGGGVFGIAAVIGVGLNIETD
ncbi:hypothetical protein HDU67_007272 [Dinochytrium kinnereticum]|nr:hypothetical protein HDU67_007272 [Dinochytrium kinnereticum]